MHLIFPIRKHTKNLKSCRVALRKKIRRVTKKYLKFFSWEKQTSFGLGKVLKLVPELV